MRLWNQTLQIASMQNAGNDDIGGRWFTSKSEGFLYIINVQDFLHGHIKVKMKLFLDA